MKLYVTIGLPRSGKSTWARETGFPIVNRDSIRKAIGGSIRYFDDEVRVTEIEVLMVMSLFYAGHEDVVVDATHLKSEYRRHWIELARDLNAEIEYVLFDTPVDVCIERAKKDFPEETNFPSVIVKMHNSFAIEKKLVYHHHYADAVLKSDMEILDND